MTEPLVLVNLFSMPAEMVDTFVAGWEKNTADARDAPGFRGTRLHRALDPDARYPIVNIARWDSVEEWEAAIGKHYLPGARPAGASLQGEHPGAGPVSAHPQLYQVVHVTPDPREAEPDRSGPAA